MFTAKSFTVYIYPDDSPVEVIERITFVLGELGIRVTETEESNDDGMLVRSFEFTHAERLEDDEQAAP